MRMTANQERNSTYEVRYRAKVAEGAVGEQGNTDNNTYTKITHKSISIGWRQCLRNKR